MANVPVTNGPQVSPSAQPAPGVRVQPPAEAFGGNALAAGAAEVGKVVGDASEAQFNYAQQMQGIANKQAADSASVNFYQDANQKWEEFKQNNTQMKAVEGYPALQADIAALRTQYGQHLSPLAAVEYEAQSRRFAAGIISSAGSYAADQGHQANILTQDALAKTAGQQFAVNPTPDNEQHFMATVGSAAFGKFQAAGLQPDDPQVQQQMVNYTSPVYSTVISNLYAGGDIQGAKSALDKYSQLLTPEAYRTLSSGLRSALQASTISTDVQTALHGGTFTPSGTDATAATPYHAAIHAREGTTQNPFSSATGEGQFVTGTWLNVLKSNPEFADAIQGKTDAQILGLRGNSQIASEAIDAYARMNSRDLTRMGISPTPANLGLAHGFGSEGAKEILDAPPGTPMAAIVGEHTAEINRLTGKTNTDVLADYAHRFGDATAPAKPLQLAGVPAIQPGADIDSYVANADLTLAHNASLMYPNDPQRQQQMIATGQAQVRREAAPVQAGQRADYDTMAKWGLDHDVQDPNAFAQQFPTQWSQMPAKYQAALEASAKSNANNITPERRDEINRLTGLAYDPAHQDAFLQADIRSDALLPPAYQTRFLQLQAQLKAQREKGTSSDTPLKQAMASPTTKAALQGLSIGQGGDQYFAFQGALQLRIQEFQEQHGKPPTNKDTAAMVTDLTATHGESSTIAGVTIPWTHSEVPNFMAVSDQAKGVKQIIDRAASRGRTLSVRDAEEIYRNLPNGQ